MEKRRKELARQDRKQEKLERREQRKAERAERVNEGDADHIELEPTDSEENGVGA
jgi:hypothetical protein